MATAQQTKKIKDDNSVNKVPVASAGSSKETEPIISSFEDEEKILQEITSKSRELDNEAIKETLERVKEQVPEAKERISEPELTKEVRGAGVINPQEEAERSVTQGRTLDLPLSEEEYQRGLKSDIGGKSQDKSIVGVSSLIALTMWVGRMIKKAHKHTMRVVFKKEVGHAG